MLTLTNRPYRWPQLWLGELSIILKSSTVSVPVTITSVYCKLTATMLRVLVEMDVAQVH